jgi:hypothetical protein
MIKEKLIGKRKNMVKWGKGLTLVKTLAELHRGI